MRRPPPRRRASAPSRRRRARGLRRGALRSSPAPAPAPAPAKVERFRLKRREHERGAEPPPRRHRARVDRVRQQDGQNLARRHYRREQHRAEFAYRVQDAQLSARARERQRDAVRERGGVPTDEPDRGAHGRVPQRHPRARARGAERVDPQHLVVHVLRAVPPSKQLVLKRARELGEAIGNASVSRTSH
eukprot:12288-Pelagococcus_subviridis.AAC.3